MLERVSVSLWELEVDRARTQAAYDRLPRHSQSCPCLHCSNFENACEWMPSAWWAPFHLLGIDPRKASGEVYQNYENEDTTHSYGGIFHLCGRVISRKPAGEPIAGDLSVTFTDQLVLVPEDFPAPILHMEIDTTMPWVLPTRLGH